MVKREIKIDEETDRILSRLASEHEGDLGETLAEVVHTRAGLEELGDESEAANEGALRAMRDRAEADFRKGRGVARNDVKARNRL